jgi:hypothetical protein
MVESRSVLQVAMILVSLLVAARASAGVVTRHYEFPKPGIELVGGYHRVTMEDAWNHGAPGEPVLPMAGARLLLPPGEVITGVTVATGERVVLGTGFLVEPGQRQYPTSYSGPIERIAPNYAGTDVFPRTTHDEPLVGSLRGYTIANLALRPVEFIPTDGTVAYYRSMDVTITTAPSGDAMRATGQMVRHDESTLAQVRRVIDNAGALGEYAAVEKSIETSRALDPSLGYKYVIITTDSWDEYLASLVTFETERGHKAEIFLRSWIIANYAGADDQTKIRNFIKDAYNTWGTDYVLLVGDARDPNGIPHRGLWNDADGSGDDDIPADLYYAALDGTWNADGDDRWGEYSPEEADLYPEVAVGRACVSSATDVQNFVRKTIRFQDSPVVSESDNALMVGELLNTSPLTYGDDYKDEIRYGSSANGYTTAGLLPGAMNVGILYDHPTQWNKYELLELMNSGTYLVNHLGHSNVQYAMRMTNADIPSFDNDGTTHSLNFVYSQGCYCGAFDDKSPDGLPLGDCFAERLTCDEHGAVAAIMNSRYGWYAPGGTNGSSQFFDREFFDAMFGERIYALGEANNDSKMDVVWALPYEANRWCFYEINLFGDPAMELWTGEPTPLQVSLPVNVMVGQPDMDVTVLDSGGAPVADARVTVITDDRSAYDTGLTDGAGFGTVHPSPASTGTLHVKVTAHDRLVWNGDVPIIPASGPYIALLGWTVDDDVLGESNGNGDGVLNAGEKAELFVTLKNAGVGPAYGVAATLASTSGSVTIRDTYRRFWNIPASGTGVCTQAYRIEVPPGIPDGEEIPFQLTITDHTRATRTSRFQIAIAAPVILYADHTSDDPLYSGNGSGCAEAGETFVVGLSLKNAGSGPATGVSAVISTNDPYVRINTDTAGIASLGSRGGTGTLAPEYSATLLPDCPPLHEITFDVAVTADWGYATTTRFSVLTAGGPFADDVETGEGEWTHGVVTPGFGDEWHIETRRSHSAGHSWKFGGAGPAAYLDSSDGALYSRPMCIGSEGELTFWNWMDAEEEYATPAPGSAWDCGLVQITTDGGASWSVLMPDGGYSHTKNYNGANPLPEGTPCWSGQYDWRKETFDLASYAGETIQIRFRFASDAYVPKEGWYVDDVNLTFQNGNSTVVVEDPVLPRVFALKQNAPNPFNPVTVIEYELPEAAHVTIDVFNLAGRLVRTVVDETQEPGYRAVVWDGTNGDGLKVASGVYLYRMQAGRYASQKRMVLLK